MDADRPQWYGDEARADFGRAALARLAERLAQLPASHPSSAGYRPGLDAGAGRDRPWRTGRDGGCEEAGRDQPGPERDDQAPRDGGRAGGDRAVGGRAGRGWTGGERADGGGAGQGQPDRDEAAGSAGQEPRDGERAGGRQPAGEQPAGSGRRLLDRLARGGPPHPRGPGKHSTGSSAPALDGIPYRPWFAEGEPSWFAGGEPPWITGGPH